MFASESNAYTEKYLMVNGTILVGGCGVVKLGHRDKWRRVHHVVAYDRGRRIGQHSKQSGFDLISAIK